MISSNCLVSGMRGKWNGTVKIPNNFVCQLVKLQPNWRKTLGIGNVSDEESEDESFVIIYHDINNAIKAHKTCYGVLFDQLQLKAGLSHNELWEENDQKKLLWNAKVNPIITKRADDLFDWSILSWIDGVADLE